MKSARGWALLAAAIPLLFVTWFFLWPLVAILGRGLIPRGHPSFGVVETVLGEARTQRILWFTLWQAVVSTVISVGIGVPVAYCTERLRLPGHQIVRVIVMLPFALPTLVVAAGFVALVGRGSVAASLDLVPSTAIVIGAHVYFNVAVVVRIVGTRWRNLDPQLWHAAATLRQPPRLIFATLTAPLLAPAIAGAAAIVFLFCATSFGVVLALGGPRQSTIETEIYRLTTQELALNRAAVLVIVQLIAVGFTLWGTARASRSTYSLHTATIASVPRTADALAANGLDAKRRAQRLSSRALWSILQWAVATVVLLPLLAIVVRSMSSGGSGFRYLTHRSIGQLRPIDSVWTSVRTACWATAFAMVIGSLGASAIARGGRVRRLVDGALLLPLGVSAVTIGFGFLIALDRPLDLRDSWLLVPLAQATIAVPFVIRFLVPALRSIDVRLSEAAAVLGVARVAMIRTVTLPLLRRAFMSATAFAFAISLGEFGATTFVGRSGQPTVPIMIGRLLGRPGDAARSGAYALAVILVIGTAVLDVATERAGTARGSVL